LSLSKTEICVEVGGVEDLFLYSFHVRENFGVGNIAAFWYRFS
jgi:hypothetical protein